MAKNTQKRGSLAAARRAASIGRASSIAGMRPKQHKWLACQSTVKYKRRRAWARPGRTARRPFFSPRDSPSQDSPCSAVIVGTRRKQFVLELSASCQCHIVPQTKRDHNVFVYEMTEHTFTGLHTCGSSLAVDAMAKSARRPRPLCFLVPRGDWWPLGSGSRRSGWTKARSSADKSALWSKAVKKTISETVLRANFVIS